MHYTTKSVICLGRQGTQHHLSLLLENVLDSHCQDASAPTCYHCSSRLVRLIDIHFPRLQPLASSFICVSYIRQYMLLNRPNHSITDSFSLAPRSRFLDTVGSRRRFAAVVALAFCLVARVMSSAACRQVLLPHSLVPSKLIVSSKLDSMGWLEGMYLCCSCRSLPCIV